MSIYHVSPRSGNDKTGPMVVTMSSQDTCPNRCPFKGNGCYAESGPLFWHWSEVTKGRKGDDWDTFLVRLKLALLSSKVSIWRHNQAGDLPVTPQGFVNWTRVHHLAALCQQTGKRGFTYSHHDICPSGAQEVGDRGFVINASCETEEKADRLKRQGLQVALVLPSSAAGGPRNWKTRGGNTVTLCPAYYTDITCAECKLCASNHPKRAIVGFPAHGNRKKKVDRLLLELEVRS